jgi:hypothetical protein
MNSRYSREHTQSIELTLDLGPIQMAPTWDELNQRVLWMYGILNKYFIFVSWLSNFKKVWNLDMNWLLGNCNQKILNEWKIYFWVVCPFPACSWRRCIVKLPFLCFVHWQTELKILNAVSSTFFRIVYL